MTRKRLILVSSGIGTLALVMVGIAKVPDAFDRAMKKRFIGPEHDLR